MSVLESMEMAVEGDDMMMLMMVGRCCFFEGRKDEAVAVETRDGGRLVLVDVLVFEQA